MCTSQEESDTIVMLHAIDVASQKKNAAINILSTDTDFNPCSGLFSNTCIEPMYANWSWKKQEIDCTETNL